ncbi:hypothetical protein HDU96_002232, partial [Phlyctochytrium bullatum]
NVIVAPVLEIAFESSKQHVELRKCHGAWLYPLCGPQQVSRRVAVPCPFAKEASRALGSAASESVRVDVDGRPTFQQ